MPLDLRHLIRYLEAALLAPLHLGGLGLEPLTTLFREERITIASLRHELGLIRSMAGDFNNPSAHDNNLLAKTKPPLTTSLLRHVIRKATMTLKWWT